MVNDILVTNDYLDGRCPCSLGGERDGGLIWRCTKRLCIEIYFPVSLSVCLVLIPLSSCKKYKTNNNYKDKY